MDCEPLPPGVELVQVRLAGNEGVGLRMEEINAAGVGDMVVQWCGVAGMGREGGQGAADGADAVVEGLGIAAGHGLARGDVVALADDPAGGGGYSGLVRYFGRIFGNEATVRRVSGADPARSGPPAGGFRARSGVRPRRVARIPAPGHYGELSQEVSGAPGLSEPDAGLGVVTGGRRGLQASGGKESAKDFLSAAFVTRC